MHDAARPRGGGGSSQSCENTKNEKVAPKTNMFRATLRDPLRFRPRLPYKKCRILTKYGFLKFFLKNNRVHAEYVQIPPWGVYKRGSPGRPPPPSHPGGPYPLRVRSSRGRGPRITCVRLWRLCCFADRPRKSAIQIKEIPHPWAEVRELPVPQPIGRQPWVEFVFTARSLGTSSWLRSG